jgi:signal transduction histidine kinase
MTSSVAVTRRISAAAARAVLVCAIGLIPAAASGAEFSTRTRILALWSGWSLTSRPWYVAAAAALIVAQLVLVGALLAHRSRRRQAELALHHSEARTAALLHAMPDLMFVIRADGVYLDYHARDPRMLFAPPEQFIGRHIAEVMPPELATMFTRELAAVRGSAEPRVLEYSLPLGDEQRHYESRLVACEADTVVSIVRDITARKRTETALHDNEIELRSTVERNRHLAGRLIAAQEGERHRIARELHDDLSQKLAMLSIDLTQLGSTSAMREVAVAAGLQRISDRTNEIASGVHRLSHRLHPARLHALGLIPSLEALCRDTSRQHGTLVEFKHDDVRDLLDPDLALCLYRVAQEALRNVVRHSGATHASVRLRHRDEEVSLQIADDGAGFLVREREATGLGLISMRERVTFLGGTLTIDAAPGRGTQINVIARRSVAAGLKLPHAPGSV